MYTFPTPAPITATFTTAAARIHVTATDRTDTVVSVDGTGVDVEFADGGLSIEKSKRGGTAVITVQLPTGSGLVLNTAQTDVHAEGSYGDCEVQLAAGQVRLDRVGSLHGHFAANEVHVGHAVSGVELNGSSGRVEVDRADGDVVVKAADCPLRIGRLTGGRADLANAAGGIEVGIPAGTAAEVDAESTKGPVRNSLATQGNPAETTVKVLARTRRDDIVIHQS